jgi:hypothetical protein
MAETRRTIIKRQSGADHSKSAARCFFGLSIPAALRLNNSIFVGECDHRTADCGRIDNFWILVIITSNIS